MFTNQGVSFLKLSIAVQRRFKNNEGTYDTDFIPCTIWRKQAENTANYCRKGSLIGISGRIQTRQFTNKHDERVFMTEVIGEDVQFLKLQPTTNHQEDSPVKQTSSS